MIHVKGTLMDIILPLLALDIQISCSLL